MPVKYKLDQVIEIFKNNECELLSKEYKNNKSIYIYIYIVIKIFIDFPEFSNLGTGKFLRGGI